MAKSYYVNINKADVRRAYGRFLPTAGVMDGLSVFLVQQVRQRFITAGMSGGAAWKPKRISQWGFDDGRAILTGTSATLLPSFGGLSAYGWASVGSPEPYSLIHQVGTIGKGGTLPDIKPKTAKALFIPITDRARHSGRLTGEQSDAHAMLAGQMPFGAKASGRPRRFGVVHHETNTGMMAVQYVGLRPGRLGPDHQLEVKDPATGEWVKGTPDYIFLFRISIPARPMLPTSANEIQAAIAELFALMRKAHP